MYTRQQAATRVGVDWKDSKLQSCIVTATRGEKYYLCPSFPVRAQERGEPHGRRAQQQTVKVFRCFMLGITIGAAEENHD